MAIAVDKRRSGAGELKETVQRLLTAHVCTHALWSRVKNKASVRGG